MFGKENAMKMEEGKISTIIAKGTKITGNIDMQGSLRIDGYLKGQVNSSETLTIGATGVVEGEVKVKEAVVGGKVLGNLIATQKVELESNAAIMGDVKTRIFVIKEGGIFHGNCSMKAESEDQKSKAEPSRADSAESKPPLMTAAGPGKPQGQGLEPKAGKN
jgi:cytoskeletal protein CcmA (bactofilin family)